MPTQTKSLSQGLFSEPAYSETGVWCELNPGIDPAEWAGMCRYIGRLDSGEFKKLKKTIIPSPDSLKSRLKRMFDLRGSDLRGIPIFSLGPRDGWEISARGGKESGGLAVRSKLFEEKESFFLDKRKHFVTL